MVVSRSDVKRKRKSNEVALNIMSENPKRTKVHAQRKFAQGSNVSSPVITPVKEIDREKVKCNEVLQPTELLPLNRPSTEDFLTFLCFRGTRLLPPQLNFFNSANSVGTQCDEEPKPETKKTSSSTIVSNENSSSQDNSEKPFIAFGVRKRADPFVNNKMEKKRRHTLALQALRRKHQEQRVAKLRAFAIEQMSEGVIKNKNLVRTRSVAKQENRIQTRENIKVVTKHVKITRSPIKRPILKQKMCLRSRGRLVPRELSTPIKKRSIPVRKIIKPKEKESSSEFSSDDDEPLVKPVKKPEKLKTSRNVAKKTVVGSKKTKIIRFTRNSRLLVSQNNSQRPSRKTKEAATLYMELLGRKLVNDIEIDDDHTSIDSFPELPNVRRTEQRENEIKANFKKQPDNKNAIKKSIKEKNIKMKKTIDNKSEKKEESKKMLRSKADKTISKVEVREEVINKSTIEIFNDSDEEPLSNLTNQKNKTKTVQKPNKKSVSISESKSVIKKKISENISNDKLKYQLIKREIKTLSKYSLSDEDDFRGFVQTDAAKKNTKPIQETKCVRIKPEINATEGVDLLCKDIGRSFGKGKVNMSTEQIQKWLKDSALAEECSKKENFEKKYEDDILKYDIKPDDLSNIKLEDKELINLTNPVPIKPIQKIDTIKLETPKLNKNQKTNDCKYTFQQRRTVLNKDKKDTSPNTTAFSPENECSVYAFQAEIDSPINTPFRSNVRRPSSTSRSEDEVLKLEDDEKNKTNNKFRLPSIIKSTPVKNQGKQELSLTLSTEEANSSASIAVQVNLDSDFTENGVSMEYSNQTDGDEDGQMFYIPLQQGKQANSQMIQGVAVKLGTEAADGGNQRVVMRAKLVTQPEKIPVAEKKSSMCPPIGKVQPTYHRSNKTTTEKPTENEKKNIPSSPSASSSSSAKTYKRTVKSRGRALDFCLPVNSSDFPSVNSPAQLVEAPTFQPTEKEFQDPLEYIEKIRPRAEKFGICRIIPPANFKPECKVSDDMRFTAYNQYVHKMLHRWGPNFKELMAIKKYLATQSINFTRPPWIGGMEIDLPRLYQTVQSLGGLKEVIEKKRWPKVAEGMKIPKSAQDRVTKLDDIYCKYLLPYDTLSPAEREKLFDEVETDWAKRESRNLLKAQKNNSADVSTDSDSDSEDEELDECTVKGRSMALNAFYRIARNTMSMWFRSMEPSAQEVEQEFWKHVIMKQNHICVHSGSIDCGGWGYGFACSKNSPFARHPWNLKILTNNSGSVLRSMGPVMGVTVPTLHVGMVFTACCWYRDPHGLPWIEYLHTGANKIWYGIPDSFSKIFNEALQKIVPSYCRNKTLWLTSDTAMVPPSLLVKNGVSLCRTVQEPGQFIVVFPKAFTSSICSGYVVSESVYFANSDWLHTAEQAFKDIRESCEPSMFSLERLLLSIASDSRTNPDILKQILPAIEDLKYRETIARTKLESLGLKTIERIPLPDNGSTKKKRKLQEDDGEYECEICRTNLFVSLVIDSQEEGVYCLDHAVDHIKEKTEQLKHCKLLFTYSIQELDDLTDKIHINIETKPYSKKLTKNISKTNLLK